MSDRDHRETEFLADSWTNLANSWTNLQRSQEANAASWRRVGRAWTFVTVFALVDVALLAVAVVVLLSKGGLPWT